MRPRRSSPGFTLVELLVVIAIIGILAGLLAAALPRALERARIANALNNFNQIRTILTAYLTDNGSFPPAYGYLSNAFATEDFRVSGDELDILIGNNTYSQRDAFFLDPWTARNGVDIHENQDLYDTFAKLGYDADQDGTLTRLEFAPIGSFVSKTEPYEFNFTELYLGNNGSSNSDSRTIAEVDRELTADERRPYIYIPVNLRQFKRFARIMADEAAADGNPSDPRPFNLSASALNRLATEFTFPPPTYDAYVLISVGPDPVHGTDGILPEFGVNGCNLPTTPLSYQYHYLGLAAYFMATRDAEGGGKGDGELDFDFLARTRRGQAKDANNQLPNTPNAAGPLIFVP